MCAMVWLTSVDEDDNDDVMCSEHTQKWIRANGAIDKQRVASVFVQ